MVRLPADLPAAEAACYDDESPFFFSFCNFCIFNALARSFTMLEYASQFSNGRLGSYSFNLRSFYGMFWISN
jgi:hypothetical protein